MSPAYYVRGADSWFKELWNNHRCGRRGKPVPQTLSSGRAASLAIVCHSTFVGLRDTSLHSLLGTWPWCSTAPTQRASRRVMLYAGSITNARRPAPKKASSIPLCDAAPQAIVDSSIASPCSDLFVVPRRIFRLLRLRHAQREGSAEQKGFGRKTSFRAYIEKLGQASQTHDRTIELGRGWPVGYWVSLPQGKGAPSRSTPVADIYKQKITTSIGVNSHRQWWTELLIDGVTAAHQTFLCLPAL